ncbi:hypothetical protein RB195_018311 [Necator americanus]
MGINRLFRLSRAPSSSVTLLLAQLLTLALLSASLRDSQCYWFPDFDYPGMPTVDYLRIKTPGPGVYKVKFGNEQAWIRSLTVYYRILFENEKGGKADFKELA